MRRIGVLDAIHGIAARSIVVHRVLLSWLRRPGCAVNMFLALSRRPIQTTLLDDDLGGSLFFSSDARRSRRRGLRDHIATLAVGNVRRASIIALVPARPGRG